MAGGVRVVEIQGLRDLQRDLRQLDKTLPRELRKVNLSVAEDIAVKARTLAVSQGGVIAKAAPAIRAGADQRSAWVKIMANKFPFALGAEFGAYHNKPRIGRVHGGGARRYVGFRQFRLWRGNDTGAGYALYPTIRGDAEHILVAYEKRLGELLDRVFPD